MSTSAKSHSPFEISPTGHRSPRHSLLNKTAKADLLIVYFRSGWAFLIPYLAAYLLYAWLKWPVNPAAGSQQLALSNPVSRVPCLLYTYWFLHGIHLVFGCLSLRRWWHNPQDSVFNNECPTIAPNGPQQSLHLQTIWRRLYAVLPWICLALFFWIPGVYLEFPSDPWEHYSRINEWKHALYVSDHYTWIKSSYYLAYTFIGKISPPLLQLRWFDVYYTICCLLLCWQYYLLARVIGLSKQMSFLFVLLNALTMGNNIFGFYRYYGMSSSLFAQLGAVALTRIAFDAVRITTLRAGSSFCPPSSLNTLPQLTVYRILLCGILLLALTRLNHVQGVGIAGLGIISVLVWRLMEWRRSMITWLTLTVIGLSAATIIWYPRHPALDEVYRPERWLTTWYGFNLTSPTSPTFDRATAIIGLSGLINFIAALLLLRRNHVVAWLTLMPVIALCLPMVAIPFTSTLALSRTGEIITYHRMFFSIPAGLALVTLFESLINTASKARHDAMKPVIAVLSNAAIFPLLLTLLYLNIAPANGPSFNRLFNMLMRPPADVNMQPELKMASTSNWQQLSHNLTSSFFATDEIAFVFYGTGRREWNYAYKIPNEPVSVSLGRYQSIISTSVVSKKPTVFATQIPTIVYTPLSFSGYLSQHWLPQEVALAHSGGDELEQIAYLSGYKKNIQDEFIYYIWIPNCSPLEKSTGVTRPQHSFQWAEKP